MRIFACSDLHFERYNFVQKILINDFPKDIDLLIIAGDLEVYACFSEAVKLICDNFNKIIYVAGNHEYYGSSPGKVNGLLAKLSAKHKNFYWLNNSSSIIDGIKFIGTTLWFEDRPDNILYEQMFNDFGQISGFKPWVYQENNRALDFLTGNVSQGSIVITHHLPSFKSVHPRYAGSNIERFFVSFRAEKILLEKKPAFWIHGHTHISRNYNLGSTTVICNTAGYPNEKAQSGFNPKLIIEI